MCDTPIEVIEQVTSSPNFLMIVIGAVIWLLGFFIPFIGPLIIVAGFGLTTIATIQAAMVKPVTSAFPGLLLGGLIQLIGYYVGWVILVGFFLSPLLIVTGGVLILFYGSSLALQRADIPIVKNIEGFIDSRKKKEVSKEAEKEEAADVEEETVEDEYTSEQ